MIGLLSPILGSLNVTSILNLYFLPFRGDWQTVTQEQVYLTIPCMDKVRLAEMVVFVLIVLGGILCLSGLRKKKQ
jgi:hypothetical protein